LTRMETHRGTLRFQSWGPSRSSQISSGGMARRPSMKPARFRSSRKCQPVSGVSKPDRDRESRSQELNSKEDRQTFGAVPFCSYKPVWAQSLTAIWQKGKGRLLALGGPTPSLFTSTDHKPYARGVQSLPKDNSTRAAPQSTSTVRISSAFEPPWSASKSLCSAVAFC
jgi:hypothetical protein